MMEKQRSTGRLMAPAVVCCAVLALAACGGQQAATSTSAASTVASTTETTEETADSTSTPSTESTPGTTAPPATPPPTTAGSLPPVPNEQESIEYDHPNLGLVTISISYPDAEDDYGSIDPTVQARVNATGKTVFEWTGIAYLDFEFADQDNNPDITSPVDGRGHVFFSWDPGRLPGISYLVPTDSGFDSNGTLSDDFDSGHYYANLVDTDSDGNYEIEQSFQRCDPDCARGGGYSHIWTWDGSNYTGSSEDPGRDENGGGYEDGDAPGDAEAPERAKELFTDYLLAVGARDYERAWSMLDSYYQDEYGGFDNFVSFWDRIASVGTESMEASLGEGSVGIDTIIWFKLKDGTTSRELVTVVVYYGDGGQSIGEYYVKEVLD